MYKIRMDPAYRRLHAAEAILADLIEREEGLKKKLKSAQARIEKAKKPEIEMIRQEIADFETLLAAVAFEIKQATETLERARVDLPRDDRCRRVGCRNTRRASRKSGSDRKRRRGTGVFCGQDSGLKNRVSTKALRELVGNEELNVVITQ